jgi:hypothetical protein
MNFLGFKPPRRIQVVLGALVLAGTALATLIPWSHTPGTEPGAVEKFVEGLGEALAIAAVLGLVVDEAAKRSVLSESLREFTERISLHIIGHLHDQSLREVVERHLKGDLVRTKWTVTYTISDWPTRQGTEYKQLLTESDYDMKNVSTSQTDYACHYEVEESLFTSIGVARIDRVEWKGFAYVDGQTPAPAELTRPRGKVVFHKVVPLSGLATLNFKIRSTELIRTGSIVPFFATQPVLKTTLIVKYPKASLDVWVDFSFDDAGDGEPVGDEGKKWELSKPLLPGQGFTVRFADKSATSSSTTVAT